MKRCNGCGKCCVYGGNGRLGPIDQQQIDVWAQQKPELLAYTRHNDDGSYSVWIDPETDDYYPTCPWLIEGDERYQYHCAIQAVKPQACLNYPMSVLQMLRDDCEMWEESDKTSFASFEAREQRREELKNT